MCKDFGGLGIPNLRDLNISLLGSLQKGIVQIKESFEKRDFKYDTNKPNVLHSRTAGSSSFFKGFMWAA